MNPWALGQSKYIKALMTSKGFGASVLHKGSREEAA